MREFIDKLISRLEEYIETAKSEGDFCYIEPFEIAKNAVNQLAEEFASDTNVGCNGWIPVSERLPDESLNSVLGWDEYRNRCWVEE